MSPPSSLMLCRDIKALNFKICLGRADVSHNLTVFLPKRLFNSSISERTHLYFYQFQQTTSSLKPFIEANSRGQRFVTGSSIGTERRGSLISHITNVQLRDIGTEVRQFLYSRFVTDNNIFIESLESRLAYGSESSHGLSGACLCRASASSSLP